MIGPEEIFPRQVLFLQLLGLFFDVITSIGVIVVSLKFVDKKKAVYEDIYQHYNFFLNYFLGRIIYSIGLVIGLILLIVPGIIWGIRLQYYTYLIVDKKMGPIEALKKSWHMTRGNTWHLFLLGLSFLGIMILGFIIFGVGIVVAWPIVALGNAYVFRKLS